MDTRIIAFYLPQYHPFPENDEWWGKGFTEWTNVAKAKPLFRGHYQPHIPADLGFYDLRLPQVREAQVELAKKAGISGFCYYHYWFGKMELMQNIFNEVVDSRTPDFPFCLCWANESWYNKMWNKDGSVLQKKTLVEQEYLGKEDNIKHFNSLLKAFKDSRYMKIDNRLIFMIYQPFQFKGLSEFMELWNQLAKDNGLEGFYFIAYTFDIDRDYDKLDAMGFDAICSCRLLKHDKSFAYTLKKNYWKLTKSPRRFAYKDIYKGLVGDKEKLDNVFPTLVPNWDHTPRSGSSGLVFTDAEPKYFKKHVLDVLDHIKDKPKEKQICILKSWNEWGEGNYIEPDRKYGLGYIDALKEALDEFKK